MAGGSEDAVQAHHLWLRLLETPKLGGGKIGSSEVNVGKKIYYNALNTIYAPVKNNLLPNGGVAQRQSSSKTSLMHIITSFYIGFFPILSGN